MTQEKKVNVCVCSLRKERERKNSGGKGRESWRIQHKSRAFEKFEKEVERGGEENRDKETKNSLSEPSLN